MDNSADTLYLDVRGCDARVARFLELYATCKGLETKPYDANEGEVPAIRYRGVHIEGLWPSLLYIQDVRRYPELLPDQAVQRALVWAVTERVLHGRFDISQLRDCYTAAKGPYLSGGDRPTLLDLALAAAVPEDTVILLPWLQRMVDHLQQAAPVLGTEARA